MPKAKKAKSQEYWIQLEKKKLNKWHFVIHNQGVYDPSKKLDLLEHLRAVFGSSLTGFMICQEHYKINNSDGHPTSDTHLQGNLFFANQRYKHPVLKSFQEKYQEQRDNQHRLLYRTQICCIRDDGKAYNYMINSAKEGGDPTPLTNMSHHRDNHQTYRPRVRLPNLGTNVLHNIQELLRKLESEII